MAWLLSIYLPIYLYIYINGGYRIQLSPENAAYAEFKSFPRLLFRQDQIDGSNSLDIHKEKNKILSLDYASNLRHSTLLHHIISNAPPQLNSPHIKAGM